MVFLFHNRGVRRRTGMNKKYPKILSIAVVFIVLSMVALLMIKDNEALMEQLKRDELVRMKKQFLQNWGEPIDQKEVVRVFKNNFDEFNDVAKHISNYQKEHEETFFIEKASGSFITKLSSSKGQKIITFSKETVRKSIKSIFNVYQYKYIYEDGGNGVYFTLNDTNIDFGHGVVFTKDGKAPDGWGITVTKVVMISDNWYYFEAK